MVEQALSRGLRFELYPVGHQRSRAGAAGTGRRLAAAITCASVALVHAGIECFDLVASCEAARVGGHLLWTLLERSLQPPTPHDLGVHAECTR